MKHTLHTLLAVVALWAALPAAGLAQTAETRLVITDPGATSGMPAPFLHRPNGPGYLVQSYVFDTLVGQDRSGALVPALAASWNGSPDGLTYDVTLNADARWHDGEDVTPRDVQFTFQYMDQNPYPFALTEIVSNVEILSDDALRITLKRQAVGFARTVLATMPILPAHVYAGHPNANEFTSPEAAIGSGPYRFVSYDRAQGRYRLEAVEDYYLGSPRFSELTLVRMAPNAAIAAVSKGDADVIDILPARLAEKAMASGLIVVSAVSNHPDRLAFNHDGMFGQSVVRQAMAHMIDRKKLVEIAYQGAAEPAQLGYFQEGSLWYNGDGVATYPLDFDKAGELLKSTGWTKGDNGIWEIDGAPVHLRLIAEKGHEKLAIVLADQFAAFGLDLDVRLLEPGAISKAVKSRDYDLVLTKSSTLGDPSGIFRRIFGKVWRSDQYTGDGSLRKLLNEQDAASDLATRKALLHKFQVKYAEELPSIMLTNPVWCMAHNGKISPAYLPDGVAMGIPLAMHKSVFFK